MSETRLAKENSANKPEGRREVVRSWIRWLEHVENDLWVWKSQITEKNRIFLYRWPRFLWVHGGDMSVNKRKNKVPKNLKGEKRAPSSLMNSFQSHTIPYQHQPFKTINTVNEWSWWSFQLAILYWGVIIVCHYVSVTEEFTCMTKSYIWNTNVPAKPKSCPHPTYKGSYTDQKCLCQIASVCAVITWSVLTCSAVTQIWWKRGQRIFPSSWFQLAA